MGLLTLEKAVAVLAAVLKGLTCGHRERRWTFLRESPGEDERRQQEAAGKNILTTRKKGFAVKVGEPQSCYCDMHPWESSRMPPNEQPDPTPNAVSRRLD